MPNATGFSYADAVRGLGARDGGGSGGGGSLPAGWRVTTRLTRRVATRSQRRPASSYSPPQSWEGQRDASAIIGGPETGYSYPETETVDQEVRDIVMGKKGASGPEQQVGEEGTQQIEEGVLCGGREGRPPLVRVDEGGKSEKQTKNKKRQFRHGIRVNMIHVDCGISQPQRVRERELGSSEAEGPRQRGNKTCGEIPGEKIAAASEYEAKDSRESVSDGHVLKEARAIDAMTKMMDGNCQERFVARRRRRRRQERKQKAYRRYERVRENRIRKAGEADPSPRPKGWRKRRSRSSESSVSLKKCTRRNRASSCNESESSFLSSLLGSNDVESCVRRESVGEADVRKRQASDSPEISVNRLKRGRWQCYSSDSSVALEKYPDRETRKRAPARRVRRRAGPGGVMLVQHQLRQQELEMERQSVRGSMGDFDDRSRYSEESVYPIKNRRGPYDVQESKRLRIAAAISHRIANGVLSYTIESLHE